MNSKVVTVACVMSFLMAGCNKKEEVAAENVQGEAIFKKTVANVPASCEGGGIVTNDEVTVSDFTPVRLKPSASAEKLRRPADSIIGAGEPQQVDNSTRLRELCRQKDWSKVQIVDPDWMTWVQGWVPVKSLRQIERDQSEVRKFVDADFIWDKDTNPYKAKLITAVNRIARENSRCSSIEAASLARSGSRSKPGKPVFYVTFGGAQPFNVWFEPEDATRPGGTFAPKRNIGRGDAVLACEQGAKQAANNPQTVDFSTFMDVAFVPYPNGNSRLISSFTAKNAFGVEGKFRIECLFEGNSMTETNIGEVRS